MSLEENARMSNPSGPAQPWLAAYPPSVDPGLTAPVESMLDAWRRNVTARPDAAAVHYFDQSLTFAQLDEASDALAVGFERAGVRTGDRIAVYLQNDPQWLVCLLAAWKCGAAVACVNPMLRAHELRHLLADCAPRVLVSLDSLYAEVVAPIREELEVPTIVTTAPWDMVPDAPAPDVFAWGTRRTFADTLDWRDLQNTHAGERPAPRQCSGSDIALLTYTSGTTGRAKGAMNLHAGVAHSAQVFATWFDIDPDRDVILGVAPLFHITGSVAGLSLSILTGAPLILLHRFDAATTLEAVERHRATFTVLASTAYNALSSHADAAVRDLSSLTKAASGGAPMSPALVDRVREQTGWDLRGVYGLTESTSPATLCPLDGDLPVEPESGALSVGVPVPGADLGIVDVETGEPLPVGSVGEITISGPMVVPGYWRSPEESAQAVREGVLFTGDVGVMNEQGWLFVVDRKKDLINAGGYKIWPRDVEDVLAMHPAVREAAVIGVPDEYRGETVKAVVSLHSEVDATPEEIIAFCKANIAAYKYPRIVEIVDELPKNASGKILRRALRDTAGAR
jgi:long-chain acyl-CoA synthetase